MTLPITGPLSLSAIYTEINGSHSSQTVSLRAMSAAAGFTTPDAVSEFYGYTHASPPYLVAAGISGMTNYCDSTAGVTNWTSGTVGTNHHRAVLRTSSGAVLIGGSQDIIYRSTNGTSWSSVYTTGQAIYGFATDGNTIVAIGGDSSPKLWRSTNDGVSWSDLSSNLPSNSNRLYSVVYKDPYWLISSGPSYLKRSTDLTSWTSVHPTSSTCRKMGVSKDDDRIVTVSDLGTIYYTDNFGSSWATASGTLPGNASAIDSKAGGTWIAASGNSSVRRSTNNGATWSSISTGLTGNVFGVYYDAQENTWFASCTNSTYMRYSTNDGTSWSNSTSFGTTAFAGMVRR